MKKLYVIIDRQYDSSYRAVQAGHAVAQYLIHEDDQIRWDNETLVYVVSTDMELDIQILEEMGLKLFLFREPDLGNKITSFACYSDDKVFQRFEMN